MYRKIILICALILSTILNAQVSNKLIKKLADGTVLSDNTYFCPGESFNLSVNATATSTGDYKVESYGTNLLTSGAKVPFPNTSGNNHLSSVITLPFTFEMYGKTYTKLVVGSNGRLILGNGSELDNLKNLQDNLQNVPINNLAYQVFGGNTYALPQIFFGFNAKNYQPNDYSKITQTTTVVDGKQSFGISIEGVNPVGNYGRKVTSSVFLISGTNQIIIKYFETDGNSLFQPGNIYQDSVLGIQNETATKGKWPSTTSNINDNDPASPYRLGRWTNSQTGFIFTPNQNLTPKIDWFLNGVSVNQNTYPNSTFSNFSPQDGDKLEARVSFVENPNDITTSTVMFYHFVKPLVQATPGTGCGNGTALSITNPQQGYTYTWFSDNPNFTATGTSFTATKNSNYYAVPNGCFDQKSDIVPVSISSPLKPVSVGEGQNFKVCDSATVNLLQMIGYTPDAGTLVSFKDIATGAVYDVNNNYTVNLTSAETKNFQLTVSNPAVVNCNITKNFAVSYLQFPNDTPQTSRKLCFGTAEYSINNFKDNFTDYAGFDIEFSTDGTNFNQNSVNPSVNLSIKVRLSKSGYECSTTFTLTFDFYPEIVVKPYSQFPEHCFSSTEYFDLNITKNELEYDDVKAMFYTSYDATSNTFSNEITDLNFRPKGINKVYVKLFNANGCNYLGAPPTLDLKIYSPPHLIKNGPEVKKSSCGGNTFNLTTNIVNYIGTWNHYSEIRYFDGKGNRLQQHEWENYNPDVSGQPSMQFVYNSTNNLECSDNIQFNLNRVEKPKALVSSILYCEETSLTWQQLKNKIITNPDQYLFYESDGTTPLRTNFNVTDLVDYYIKNQSTGCVSDLQTLSFNQGSSIPVLKNESTFTDCDKTGDLFDGKTTFDLNARKSDFTNDASANVQFYKDLGRTQEVSGNYINETTFSQDLYVKITAPGFCPSYATLHLKVNVPTKSSTLKEKYLICFGETVAVDAGSENAMFKWSNGQSGQIAYFSNPGNYSVTLTSNNGCSYVHNFVVSDENQPKINQINQTENQIEVLASGGTAPYEYFFNGQSNGNSNILLNPVADNYEIYPVSKDGCRGPSAFVYTIKIKNVITPNNDGFNDTWTIKNLDKMQEVEILISDRYGKTVFHSTDANSLVWDGKLNYRPLPTASYWYVVKWHDSTTLKNEVRQGWILLKNRD